MYQAGNSVEQVFGGTVIKQGDRTPLGFNFRSEDGELVDLTGSTVQIKVASDKGVVLEKQATISDEYTVEFAIGSEDITGAGNMRIEFIVTYPGGTIEKFPSDDWQRIRITPTLEDVEKYGVGYITFENLTKEFQNQFDDFSSGVDQQIDSQKQRVDNLISNTPQPSEVVDARLDENGIVFNNLKALLDDKGKKIGSLSGLPSWLQESLAKAVGLLNNHIRQFGVNIKQPPYNAYGDGASHPLSTRYSTLAAAQAVFPSATSLNDEIDWCAIQEALKSSVKSVFIPSGIFVVNRMLVYRDNVKMTGVGGKGASAIKTLATWDIATSPAVIKMCGNEGFIDSLNISCLAITDVAQKPDVILIDRDAVSNNVIPWENTIYNVVTNGGKNSVWVKQGLETHLTRCQFKTGSEAGVLAHQPDIYINDVSTDGCRHGLRTLGGSVTAHHFHAIYSKEEGFYIEGGDFCQFTDCHADTSGRTGVRVINTKRIMFTATWSFNSGSETTGTYSDWSLTGVTESMFTNCNEKGGTQAAQGYTSKASWYIDATSEKNHFVNCHGTLTPWGAGADNGAETIMNKNRFVACTGALARYNAKDNTSKHAFSLAGGVSTTFNSYLFFKPNLTANAMVIEIRITARETNSPQNLYFGRMYKAITDSTTATEMAMVDLLGTGSTAAKNFMITAALHADGDKITLTLTNNNTSQTINYGIEVEYMHPPKFTA